ncbi:hypothetical protein ABZT08_04045 [Streptomyces sp. NPDC005526]|uniref:hypothetical protein n=1 Tax=Streptomyces sp. NPDC005526 TaxID=3156885 RepID=UPI0033A3FBCE
MTEDWRPGYPIDLRTPEQRERNFKDHVSPDFEWSVGRVLARLTGARVYLQDDNKKQKTPDIRIDYDDGRLGHAEVWMALDDRHAEVAGVLSRRPSLVAPNLARHWNVNVTGGFRLKRDKKSYTEWLPELLTRFEAADHVYEYVPRPDNLSVHPGLLADEARELGIRGLSSYPVRDGEEGLVTFTLWEIGGPADVTWEPFHDWLDGHLNADSPHMRGNREKLARASGDERHAVVGVTMTSPWAAFHALHFDADTLPPLRPELPNEFTHLWLIGAQASDRCLAWYPDRGWFEPHRHWATD